MKISLRWLKDYVDITLTPRELAYRLTLSGNEVNSMERTGGTWEHVLVGQVVGLDKHPNADRLVLATVDLGAEKITVVTGAPNLQVGQKVPFARVGASLVDGHTGKPMVLKPARIRGVASEGMVCSELELGISDNHESIMVLDANAPVGAPLEDYMGDTVLDLKVTPNRPDCLSVLGVAWEAAALTEGRVKWPTGDYPEAGPPIESLASVEIADPDLCPRYCATLVQGIKVAPSPRWMQERLKAAGMRPINNVVDVTNYVMLEYGQPLHAFDFDRLRGRRIIVRRGWGGERLTTLDGVERSLSSEMLAIADAEGAVALAGVMGGQASEVAPDTVNVLLESANFHPISIRRTSAFLKLRSEASLRFERGLSPELPLPALRRATRLLVELGGGVAARGVLDQYPGRKERGPVVFTPEALRRLLGQELSPEEVIRVLDMLGFECRREGDRIQAFPPYWRMDVNLVDDVAEEVARVLGYDIIPTTLPSGHLPRYQPNPILDLKDRVKDSLAAAGLQEVVSYPLTSQASLDKVASTGPTPLKVANPLSAEQECLRTSLRPGILSTLSSNERYQKAALCLFEVGKTYLPRPDDLPEEREVVIGVIAGLRQSPSWLGGSEDVDFYDAKGVVESLLVSLGSEATFQASDDPDLVTGQTASIVLGGGSGVVGKVRPEVAARFGIESRSAYLFEVPLAPLAAQMGAPFTYRALPRFPGVLRDLSIVVPASVTHDEVRAVLASSPLVAEVALFDVYSGDPVPAGHKSLAFRVVYRTADRTLTEREASLAEDAIVKRLETELGARIRAS